MQITEMDIINDKIEYGAVGTTNKDITQNILKEWRGSQKILDMYEAQQYSLVKNTSIDSKTRSYEDEDGHIILNNSLSNVKSKTARYRKSLKQKLNFALAKPFIVSCDNDKYKQLWMDFLTDNIRAVIIRCSKDAINKGIGYVYPWINEKGELEIVEVEPMTLYPAWKDEAHTELDAMVRDYEVIEYINNTKQNIRKVEFWDRQIFEKFIDYSDGSGSGSLEADVSEEELAEGLEGRLIVQTSHMTSADGEGIGWGKVPFIALKSDEDELPLLNECKTDIDNYDLVKSKGLDSILDDIDAVLVVEDIAPEMGELSRARKLVQNSRIMAVDKGGNAHFEKVNTDISAIVQQLDLIRKDIQDNTDTIDVTTIQFGSNPSGKAMRTFYEPLNIWANGFESQFKVFFNNLKYFFDMWISFKGGHGSFEELQKIKITVSLDRDMLIDEDGIISNLVALGEELSQETRDELNPYIENHEKEQKRRDDEAKKAELRLLEDDVDNQNFNTARNNKNLENTEENER